MSKRIQHRCQKWQKTCAFLLFFLSILGSAIPSQAIHAAPRDEAVAESEDGVRETAHSGESVHAYEGRKVGAVVIEGLKRIEREAVLAKLRTVEGASFSAAQVRSDIQSLFQTGFFEDIQVNIEPMSSGQVQLIVEVKERPVITKIEFEGNEQISTDDLKGVVKIKEWSILDVNKVKEDVNLIQKHYEEKGFYLAKVSYTIRVIKPDEVELIYKVNDFEKVQIKKITFLNNKVFSDSQLKSVLADTKEGGLFSFLSGSGNFKESAFKRDMQMLVYWYLEHGYVKFRYENPVITVSDDKKWLYISIYVEEGEQYKIGNIDFGGDLLFPKEELHNEVHLDPGDIFSVSKRNLDIQRLTEKYQDLGYAFVNVIPKTAIHDDSKTVDIEYDFEKGNLVYIGEINIVGNSKTYDKVIRRELKIHEGELYNGTKIRESRENVERLGYFSPGEVIFNTVSPKGKTDIVNLEISVKERSTGTITLGAGYGSYQGFFFTTQISEINLMGRGQTLSLAATYSIQQTNQSLNLGFTEPYTFDTLWTTGFNIYGIYYPIPNRYLVKKVGFDVRFGHPVMAYTIAYLTYKFEGIQDLNHTSSVPQSVIDADSGLLSSLTLSVVRDKRNNRFETSGGSYQSMSLEGAGIGGDMKFFKFVANNRLYHRLFGDLVFRHNVEIGAITGYGGVPIPPAQKFYLGGPNNMRGFPLFLLGPVVTDNKGLMQPQGGNYEAYTMFELEHPLIKDAGIKGVVFFDAGNAWEKFPSTAGEPFTIRTDVGFGFRWFSPIGPLRFEWGFPLARKPGEDSTVFQFMIGPPF